MNNTEFQTIINLSDIKRYEYFIKKVVDYKKIWGLYNNGWAMVEDNNGNDMITFWPEKEFAEACAQGIWNDYRAEVIALDEFINDWLPYMEQDNIKPAIFYTLNNSGISVEINKLISDLNE